MSEKTTGALMVVLGVLIGTGSFGLAGASFGLLLFIDALVGDDE